MKLLLLGHLDFDFGDEAWPVENSTEEDQKR